MNDGGPAFPTAGLSGLPGGNWRDPIPGMTLRDYFAAHALAAMTVAPDYSSGPCNYAMAERAYIIADAMIAHRSKSND